MFATYDRESEEENAKALPDKHLAAHNRSGRAPADIRLPLMERFCPTTALPFIAIEDVGREAQPQTRKISTVMLSGPPRSKAIFTSATQDLAGVWDRTVCPSS